MYCYSTESFDYPADTETGCVRKIPFDGSHMRTALETLDEISAEHESAEEKKKKKKKRKEQ